MSKYARELEATKKELAKREGNKKVTPVSEGVILKKYGMNHLDILAKEIPPDKPILGEWLTEKGLVEIYAATGIGKTWLTLSIALSIAYQKNLLSWKAHEQKNVLYVDGEMSPYSLQKRIDRITRGMNLTIDPKVFSLINSELCDVQIPDILSPDGYDFLHSQAEGYGVLVLDSLLTLSGFTSDTESKAMVALRNLLLSFRKKGVTVIFVHHEGKSGSQLGSVMKEIYLNSVLNLSRPLDIEDDVACCFDISMNKARDCTRLVSRTKRAELIDCSDGSVIWGWKESETLLRDSVMKMFKELGMKQPEIAKEMGIHLSKVKRITSGL